MVTRCRSPAECPNRIGTRMTVRRWDGDRPERRACGPRRVQHAGVHPPSVAARRTLPCRCAHRQGSVGVRRAPRPGNTLDLDSRRPAAAEGRVLCRRCWPPAGRAREGHPLRCPASGSCVHATGRAGGRLACTVRMHADQFTVSAGSTEDSPGLRRGFVPRADGTEERRVVEAPDVRPGRAPSPALLRPARPIQQHSVTASRKSCKSCRIPIGGPLLGSCVAADGYWPLRPSASRPGFGTGSEGRKVRR